MMYKSVIILCLVTVVGGLPVGSTYAGTPTNWMYGMDPGGPGLGNFQFGAKPGRTDGYDDQPQHVVDSAASGLAISLYREHSPSWTGPTGFYYEDFESPIAPGASKTWSNIYLWAQNYSATPDHGWGAGPLEPGVPFSYTMTLVLDYVPESLGYSGPTEFSFAARTGLGLLVPIPTVTNPLDGIRMHLTVTAPVPEPSALLALGLGLLPLGGVVLRRKSRRG